MRRSHLKLGLGCTLSAPSGWPSPRPVPTLAPFPSDGNDSRNPPFASIVDPARASWPPPPLKALAPPGSSPVSCTRYLDTRRRGKRRLAPPRARAATPEAERARAAHRVPRVRRALGEMSRASTPRRRAWSRGGEAVAEVPSLSEAHGWDEREHHMADEHAAQAVMCSLGPGPQPQHCQLNKCLSHAGIPHRHTTPRPHQVRLLPRPSSCAHCHVTEGWRWPLAATWLCAQVLPRCNLQKQGDEANAWPKRNPTFCAWLEHTSA